MSDSRDNFWRKRARLTALRHNLAAWLASLLPAVLVLSTLTACTLVLLRQRGPLPPAFGPTVAIAFLLATLYALLRARNQFFTTTDALLRLDVSLGLHNRLTSAARGVGEFPPPRPTPDGFKWRWQPIAASLTGCAAVLLIATYIPVSRANATFRPLQPPTAWTETQTWAERLAESEIVEPEAVQSLEEKLAALRDQPAEEWFSHSSLEAGDSLRDQTAQSLRSLERNLTEAASQLEASAAAHQLPDSALQQLKNQFGETLADLELGNLPLNSELLADLKNLDLSQARQLSPDQMKALQERLKSGAGVCEACLGPGEGGGESLVDGLLLTPGQGGISRGPGTGPVGRTQQPTNLGGGVPEQISNEDLTRALPAEVLGVGAGEHDVPTPTDSGPLAGGTISTTGTGGDAVWRNNLNPEERQTLRRFFK